MSTTLYEKRGRRYYPVLEKNTWDSDTWTKGCHLVICEPGYKTFRYNIEPDDAAFFAAQTIEADVLARIIQEESRAKLSPEPLTQEQVEAWDALKDSFNGGPFYVSYESSLSIARQFLLRLRSIYRERDQNDSEE
jgi:hypothetical protein